jgi:membrane protein YqaA with SNARE-associated domain
LPFLKALSARLGKVLILYGGWGLFAMSFLDSSFIPFPVVNDLALIIMASQRPSRALFYALQSTLGSLLGAYLLYGIARSGGQVLWRKSTPVAVARAERWLHRNDFVALLVACLLPPPAPLKVFVLTAGILQVNAMHFAAAIFVGRCLRFGADAWLGARYGVRAEAYMKQNLGWASLAAAGLVVGLTLLWRRWAKQEAPASASGPPPSLNA